MAKTPKIKFYNSVVKGKVPNAEDAEIGEIFINANAEAPFISTKNSNGEMTKYIDEATIDKKIEESGGGATEEQLTTIAASLNDLHSNKQDTLESGTNIKTINNESLLGDGNITISAESIMDSRGNISLSSSNTINDNSYVKWNMVGGSGNTVSGQSGYSNGIFGGDNVVQGTSNLICGWENKISGRTTDSIVGGTGNTVCGYTSCIIGQANTGVCENSFIGGTGNTLSNVVTAIAVGSNQKAYADNVYLFGHRNIASGQTSFIVGSDNTTYPNMNDTCILGSKNTISGDSVPNTVALNYQNVATKKGRYGFISGAYNAITNENEAAFGIFNKSTFDTVSNYGGYVVNFNDINTTIFSIGNGVSQDLYNGRQQLEAGDTDSYKWNVTKALETNEYSQFQNISQCIRHNAFEVKLNGDIFIQEKTSSDDETIVRAEQEVKRIQTWFNEKADKEDVYTKAEIDAMITGGTSGITEAKAQEMIDNSIKTKANVSDVYTKTEVDEKVDNIVTSSTISEKIQTVVSSYTYSQSDIDTKLNDKSDRTELATVSAATQNSIDTISGTATTLRTDLDSLSGFTSQFSDEAKYYILKLDEGVGQISGNVETLSGTVENKQDTLVSGTNIKTINNQSLLGEGNITIEGGGSVTVDDSMSDTSENPVQNKVIKSYVDDNKVTKTSQLTNDSNYIVNGTYNNVTFKGNVYLSGSTHIPSEIKAEGNLEMTSDCALGKECLFKTKALMANTIYTERLAYSSGNTSTGTIYTSYQWDLPHKSGTIALTSDIPSTTNFVATSAFTSYSASTADSINKKLNTTDFNTYSAETATAIAAKADATSVPKVWSGTQTEYDAITTKDSGTIYLIYES